MAHRQDDVEISGCRCADVNAVIASSISLCFILGVVSHSRSEQGVSWRSGEHTEMGSRRLCLFTCRFDHMERCALWALEGLGI